MMRLTLTRVAAIVAAGLLLAPSAVAAQNGTTIPAAMLPFLDASGDPCSGCKLYAFASGTSTPLDTYSDVTLMTANANPVIMDSAGFPTSGAIFLSANSYKFRLDSSADVTIRTADNIAATHAGVTGLANAADLVLQVDTDNDGSNKFSFVDGLGSEKAQINESGTLQLDGDLSMDGDAQMDGDLTIGNATDADKGLFIDSDSQDFYLCVENTADDLLIGHGATCGTTPAITVTETLDATFAADVFINDTSNAKSTLGLTVNQGGADDEIVAFKSSDVDHGVTDITETDTYASLKKHAAAGALRLQAFSPSNVALSVQGTVTTDETTKSTAGVGAISLVGHKKATAGQGSMASDANVLVVANSGTTRFILDGDGDSHQDVGTAWTNFDSHDDVSVLHTLAVEVARPDDPFKDRIRAQFVTDVGAMLPRAELERIGLVTFNPDGHHFVNMSKLTMLNVGAIRQTSDKQRVLEARLAHLSEENTMLRAQLAAIEAQTARLAMAVAAVTTPVPLAVAQR